MVKIKKTRKRKSYQFNKNRKRMNKVRKASTGKIKCTDVKEFWNNKKAAGTNAREMGLSSNPNMSIPIPNPRQERLKVMNLVNGFVEEELRPQKKRVPKPRKGFVAKQLEEDANAPRESQLRLPKGHISELEYFMDKYKFNYNDMVKDRQNYYQLTWKQFRSKIRKYMSIPQQFKNYLETRNLQSEEISNWKEYSDD